MDIKRLFDAILEIGQTPGMEKYHPELKEITWLLQNHVQVVAALNKLQDSQQPQLASKNVVEHLMQ